ncbi:MAG: geranyl-CoA carboxylase alpha subunit, partial [Halieaceae bacterium]
NAIKLARAEAESAFGSGELILERAIIRPRHVEIQVFADMHGNTIHLGERDCSVQRRHQKVIEEAPCPIMTTELRDRMGRAAVDAARSVNYCGAGTVEFLLDENGEFYFLEMNTRLQVEHPVTEMITGLDLVELQIQVAQNQPLNLSQEDIILSGHAIEVRLYTEDPSQDFLPMAGSIKLWAPAQGVGVRIDSGISSDQDISPYYDPMVAKVIASGSTREEARTRLIKALKETVLFGVKNNKEFLVNCLEKDRFKAGLATTAFIAEEFGDTPIVDAVPSFSDCAVAALLSLELEYRLHCSRSVSAPPLLRSWASASPLVSRRQYGFDEVIHDLFVTAAGTNKYRVTNGELSVEIELLSMSAADAQVVIDGHMQLVHWQEPASGELHMSIEGRSAHYRDLICREGTVEETSAGDRITAPMHGLLLDILVKSGDSVGKGQTLAVLEAMKLHHEILATEAGTVTEVLAEPGTQVPADSLLITIDVNSTP